MIKLARILHIDNAEVTLKIEQNNQCLDCESHCSDGFLSFLFHKYNAGVLKVSRHNGITNSHLVDGIGFFNQDYKVNEIIGINFNEKKLLKLTALLYGLPILLIIVLLITGYLISQLLGINADLGGVVGFILGLACAKFLIDKNQIKNQPQVKFFK